ncbi:MAG: class I SAM-dependent methyltransferase [Dokdonella sp.]
MENVIDLINLRTMRSQAVVSTYVRSQGLSPPEVAALERIADEAHDRPILDIGVGGGRTVQPLLAISADYLGIDYSEQMIVASRTRFPGVRFEHADARDLSNMADGSIFLAVFSCNGLGMVHHSDRLRILREVYRVLQPGGAFLFSTHNQNCRDHVAGFRFPDFEPSHNPARILVRTARFIGQTLIRSCNRLRFSKYDVRTPEYSMINDVCHHYGTMLYYIALDNQRRQLESAGFRQDAEGFDLAGRDIRDDTTDSSITLLARK